MREIVMETKVIVSWETTDVTEALSFASNMWKERGCAIVVLFDGIREVYIVVEDKFRPQRTSGVFTVANIYRIWK